MAGLTEARRDVVICEGCGVATRAWRHVVLSVDSGPILDVRVCQRCASDAVDALKRVWEALAVRQ